MYGNSLRNNLSLKHIFAYVKHNIQSNLDFKESLVQRYFVSKIEVSLK
jgi:hypothetical protein